MGDVPGLGRLLPSPEMASTRVRVLEAAKRYYAWLGMSPSFRELAWLTGSSRSQVHDAVHALAAKGELLLRPGPRGIVLPDKLDMLSEGDVVLLLRRRGFIVDLDVALMGLPIAPVTDSHLPLPLDLGHAVDLGDVEWDGDGEAGGDGG